MALFHYLLHSNARTGSSQKAGSFTMKSDLSATTAAQSYQIRGKNSLHDFGFFEKFLSTFGGLTSGVFGAWSEPHILGQKMEHLKF